jgi:steroid delta-isomerase-like uncharacterized protein
MQSASAEMVWLYYDRFNAGDWEGMLGLLSKDVVHDINQGGREVGQDAFRAFLKRMARSYEEKLEDIEILGDGARIAAEFVVVGKYIRTDEGLPPATGQTYRLPGGAFFDLANGRITRVTNYYNLQQWLSLIGSGSSG